MTRRIAAYLVVIALLCGTLTALQVSEHRPEDALEAPLESISSKLAGWKVAESMMLTPGAMGALRPTAYIARAYEKNADRMAVFAAYYAVQRAGETMHSPRSCLPGSGWEIWNSKTEEVPFEGRPAKVRRYSIRNGNERLAVLYWYQSRRDVFSDEYLGKLLLIRDAVLNGSTSGALVRITVADDPALTGEGLAVAQALMSELRRCVGR